jgi:hypothetical protein
MRFWQLFFVVLLLSHACKPRGSHLSSIDGSLRDIIAPQKVLTAEQIRILCLRPKLATFFFNAESGQFLNHGGYPEDLLQAQQKIETTKARYYFEELKKIRRDAIDNFLALEDECRIHLHPQNLLAQAQGTDFVYPSRFVLSVIDGPDMNDSAIYWQEAYAKPGDDGQWLWTIDAEKTLRFTEPEKLEEITGGQQEIFWPRSANQLLELAEKSMATSLQKKIKTIDPSSDKKVDFLSHHFFKSHGFEVMPQLQIKDKFSLLHPVAWNGFFAVDGDKLTSLPGTNAVTISTHFLHDRHDESGPLAWRDHPLGLHFPLWAPQAVCTEFAPKNEPSRSSFLNQCMRNAQATLLQEFDPQDVPQNCGAAQAFRQGLKDQTQGFKDQAQGFKDQTQGFKDQTQGFKDQSQGLRDQMQGAQQNYDELIWTSFSRPLSSQDSHYTQGQRGTLIPSSTLATVGASASVWFGPGVALVPSRFADKAIRGNHSHLRFPAPGPVQPTVGRRRFEVSPIERLIAFDSCSVHFNRDQQDPAWESHAIRGTVFYSPFPLFLRAINYGIFRPIDWWSLNTGLTQREDLRPSIERAMLNGGLNDKEQSCRIYADTYNLTKRENPRVLKSLLSADAEADFRNFQDDSDRYQGLAIFRQLKNEKQSLAENVSLLKLAIAKLRSEDLTLFLATKDSKGRLRYGLPQIAYVLTDTEIPRSESSKRGALSALIKVLERPRLTTQRIDTDEQAFRNEWLIRGVFLSLRGQLDDMKPRGLLELLIQQDPEELYLTPSFRQRLRNALGEEQRILESLSAKNIRQMNDYLQYSDFLERLALED